MCLMYFYWCFSHPNKISYIILRRAHCGTKKRGWGLHSQPHISVSGGSRKCVTGVTEPLLLLNLGIHSLSNSGPDETLAYIQSVRTNVRTFYSEWQKKSDTSGGSRRSGSPKLRSSRRNWALLGPARPGAPDRDLTAAQVHEDAAGIYETLHFTSSEALFTECVFILAGVTTVSANASHYKLREACCFFR